MAKPRIAILALGGTIAMVQGEAGVKPGLGGEELVAAVPELSAIAEVSAHTFSKVCSYDLSVDSVLELAQHIQTLAATRSADGVIVAQGTDTIEETAFLLDLVLDVAIPVIVIGAMRHPLLTSPDGPGNLLAATRVASDPEVRRLAPELGVLVVMLDGIHTALDVVKANSHRIDAFASPHGGPLGVLIEARVRLGSLPLRPYKPALRTVLANQSCASLRAHPRSVALLTLALGEPGGLLDAMLKSADHLGYHGLVLAAMGGGHAPASLMLPIAALAAKLPVAVAGRMGNGYLLAGTYESAGAEIDMARRGVIAAGRLHPLKARLLLDVLLRAGADPATIAAIFATLN
ncbi:MAG: asparaginase [Gammaproteobacteria bacterium]